MEKIVKCVLDTCRAYREQIRLRENILAEGFSYDILVPVWLSIGR